MVKILVSFVIVGILRFHYRIKPLQRKMYSILKIKRTIIESIYGKIIGKYVCYRGKDEIIRGVQHLNVEKFLLKLQ